MTPLRERDLDAYSRFAVSVILARFPAWEALAVLRPWPDGAGHSVEFHVPCPSPAVEAGLWVSTADEELTVGFHTHHNHFTDYESRLNPVLIQAGVDHVAALLEERVGVVSYYRRGEFVGSTSVDLPHPDRLPGFLETVGDGAMFAAFFADCDRVTLRSWAGTFDRDEPKP